MLTVRLTVENAFSFGLSASSISVSKSLTPSHFWHQASSSSQFTLTSVKVKVMILSVSPDLLTNVLIKIFSWGHFKACHLYSVCKHSLFSWRWSDGDILTAGMWSQTQQIIPVSVLPWNVNIQELLQTVRKAHLARQTVNTLNSLKSLSVKKKLNFPLRSEMTDAM